MKDRTHNILFKKDSPFKPKKVQSKLRYKRYPKHKNKQNEQ